MCGHILEWINFTLIFKVRFFITKSHSISCSHIICSIWIISYAVNYILQCIMNYPDIRRLRYYMVLVIKLMLKSWIRFSGHVTFFKYQQEMAIFLSMVLHLVVSVFESVPDNFSFLFSWFYSVQIISTISFSRFNF